MRTQNSSDTRIAAAVRVFRTTRSRCRLLQRPARSRCAAASRTLRRNAAVSPSSASISCSGGSAAIRRSVSSSSPH